MMNDSYKRAVKKCLQDNGFDKTIIDELMCQRKSLRDEFAKAAMGGLITTKSSSYPGSSQFLTWDEIAKSAYRQADMMMMQREVTH
jgi:hypothetical protein